MVKRERERDKKLYRKMTPYNRVYHCIFILSQIAVFTIFFKNGGGKTLSFRSASLRMVG